MSFLVMLSMLKEARFFNATCPCFEGILDISCYCLILKNLAGAVTEIQVCQGREDLTCQKMLTFCAYCYGESQRTKELASAGKKWVDRLSTGRLFAGSKSIPAC